MGDNNNEVFFVVSVDVEEEWDWAGSFPKDDFSVKNIKLISKFQKFCNEFGVRPTYFVDYAIADNPENVACLSAFLENGECEIGAHLHPWCTPPVEEEICEKNSHSINLPKELVSEKLKSLTDKLEQNFGERPSSFRFGRWGVDGGLLKMLSKEGYTIDSSVYPYYADSCFSYHDAPDTPYWPSYENCLHEGGQREILEMPITSGYNRLSFSFWNRVHLVLSSRPWKWLRLVGMLWRFRLLRKIHLSPELADATDMIALVDAALKKGDKVIHMYFHSSSLLLGATPYVKNKSDEMAFYNNMRMVIEHLRDTQNVTFCTIKEAKAKVVKKQI